jgi:phytanoyl-CoA hydroxylase
MKTTLNPAQIQFFEKNGYLVIEKLLSNRDVTGYRKLYEDFLSNKVDSQGLRSDLGGHMDTPKLNKATERITQIMRPSLIVKDLAAKALHLKSLDIARQLLGDDMDLDFDMLIDKAPFSNTATPWHQDRAYWISMPDVRAVSCWVALDEAIKENGCMWYVPGSHHLPLRPHVPAGKGGGALQCKGNENEGVYVDLKPGGCVLHHGGTLHYSRGNSTDKRRRAFITNFRPKAMIEYERAQGYDHTGKREVREKSAATKTN